MKGIIDLDNVVSNWAGWVFSQQEEVPKTAGLRSGKLEEMWPDLTDEMVDEIVQDVRGYIDAEPMPGALDGLWDLVSGEDIEILYLSAAPLEAFDARALWLRKHGFPYREDEGVIDLIHIGDSASKVDWIMVYGEEYDFIIDDSLSHLDAALIANIPLRLTYNCPWNEGDENHDRAYSWAEAVRKIRADATE